MAKQSTVDRHPEASRGLLNSTVSSSSLSMSTSQTCWERHREGPAARAGAWHIHPFLRKPGCLIDNPGVTPVLVETTTYRPSLGTLRINSKWEKNSQSQGTMWHVTVCLLSFH